MTIVELRFRLLGAIKQRISNGEFTERGLARLTGISQPQIHKALRGDRNPSPNKLDRMCKAAGIRISASIEDES
jgi:transcriptional regulator with XRE-family HTH domain